MSSKPQNVIIIGAGISGLSAGYYCLQKGHHVTILEKCNNPGGVSTNWKRKGYTFEGGIHWLVGCTPRMQPFHRLWNETGALAENNPVTYNDPVYTYTDGTVELYLWRDAKKLRDELLQFAPEDDLAILRLYCHVRFVSHVTGTVTHWKHILYLILSLPHFLFFVTTLFFISTEKYLSHFKNPHVREMLTALINPQQNAISFIFTLAGYHLGDNGIPRGGSRRLAQNMADRITRLGGQIIYNCNVHQVVVKNRKRVVGVEAEQGFLPADHVIVALDTKTALEKLFKDPLEETWARRLMQKPIESEHCMLISLGVEADLSHLSKVMRIHLNHPMQMAGREYSTLWLNNYSGHTDVNQDGCEYCPEGCSSLSLLFMGDTYDFWLKAKQEGTYHTYKRQYIQDVIVGLADYIPQIRGHIHVTDMATPLTYERYCNSYRGGYMGIWRAGTLPPTFPCNSSTIRGLHFAGMRLRLSGGLPIALLTGYNVAKAIK